MRPGGGRREQGADGAPPGGSRTAARSATAVTGLVLAVYGWWVSGLAAFTVEATVAVAVPVAVLAALAVAAPTRPRGTGPASTAPAIGTAALVPWFVLVTVAVVLEAVGLAVGGRSPGFPTLSTVVDHALTTRWSTFALCCIWLGTGAVGAFRLLPTLVRRT